MELNRINFKDTLALTLKEYRSVTSLGESPLPSEERANKVTEGTFAQWNTPPDKG